MAEALFKAMGGSGGIVALGGILSNVPAIERKAGLDEALAENPDVELLDFQVANWDPNQAYDITSAWVTRFGDDIKGIWAANDGMGIARSRCCAPRAWPARCRSPASTASSSRSRR